MARNRSAIDTIVEDTLRELEYELESEAGAEFDTSPPISGYKWLVYTSTSLNDGDPWRFDREEMAPRLMRSGEARDFGAALLKRLVPIMAPLVMRVAVERWKMDDDGKWSPENCRAVTVLGGRPATCPTLRERKAARDRRL